MQPPLDRKAPFRRLALPLRAVWGAALVVIGAGALAIPISSPGDADNVSARRGPSSQDVKAKTR